MYMDQDNVPFYIGKGKGDRRYPSAHIRNKSHVANKIKFVGVDKVKVHFLHKDLTEKEAFKWEKYWIKYLGRQDNGTGQLTNHTDGGEGPSPSKETKRKISDALKGHKHSDETRKKISNALVGKPSGKFGKITSNKTKLKISESLKAYFRVIK